MKLEELSLEHTAAFLTMVKDIEQNDPTLFAIHYWRKVEWSEPEFAKFVKDSAKQRLDWRPGPNKVSLTRYVLRDGQGVIIANGLMRFPLDSKTEADGGNLHCDVPPSQRAKGNGSYCLSLLLFEAVRAGLRRALVTCLADDPAARKVIEKNRGELLDIIAAKDAKREGAKIARYWISFR